MEVVLGTNQRIIILDIFKSDIINRIRQSYIYEKEIQFTMFTTALMRSVMLSEVEAWSAGKG